MPSARADVLQGEDRGLARKVRCYNQEGQQTQSGHKFILVPPRLMSGSERMATTYADSMPGSETAPSGPVRLPWVAIVWFGALLLVGYAGVLNYLSISGSMTRTWAMDSSSPWCRVHRMAAPGRAGIRQNVHELLGTGAGLVQRGFPDCRHAGRANRGVAYRLFDCAVGAILFLCGTQVLRILAFPLFLLLFMVPIPAMIYAASRCRCSYSLRA